MKKVICFTRVSTTLQNLESQEKEVVTMALNDGYKKNQIILISEKESGYCLEESERDGLNKLKETIEENDIQCVYIWEFSRIARKLKIVVSISDYLKKRNINLKVRKDSLCMFLDNGVYNPVYQLMMSILASFAEMERDMLVSRTRRGKQQAMEEGKATIKNLKYGYCVGEDNKIVIDEEKASIVRKIFAMYANGQSSKAIATYLNEKGISYKKTKTSKSAKGNEQGMFTRAIINNILSCGAYIGLRSKSTLEKHKDSVGLKYPPILDKELFDKCKTIAQQKNLKGTAKEANKLLVFGKGLLKDMDDIIKGGEGRSLNSKVASGKYQNQITNKGVSINFIDFILWETAKQFRVNIKANIEEIEKIKIDLEDVAQKLIVCNKELAKVNERENKINEKFAKGSYDDNETLYNKMMEIVKHEKEKYQKQSNELHKQLENLNKLLVTETKTSKIDISLFENYGEKEQLNLIHQVIERAEIHKETRNKVNVKVISKDGSYLNCFFNSNTHNTQVVIGDVDYTMQYKPRFVFN